MVIGRGRRREHLIYENKSGGSFLWSQDADVVENTPNQHFVLLLRKQDGKKYGKIVLGKKIREKNTGKKVRGKNTGKKSGEKSRDFRSLPVKHAQWSDPPHRSPSNMTLSVPVYYYHVLVCPLYLTSSVKLYICCIFLNKQ